MKNYFFYLLIFSLAQGICAQPDDIDRAKALKDMEIIRQQNRFVESFVDMDWGAVNPHNLPIGIKKIVGNIPVTLAVSNVRIGAQYGELTLLVQMDIPQKSQSLYFGATGIKISGEGDLIGDVKLSLLGDVPISMGHLGDLIIKGSLDASTGASTSATYVSLDCTGEFIELSLNGDLVLNGNTFQTKEGGPVKASFHTVINDWNNLLISLSFPTCSIRGLDGFEFTLFDATLDFSDFKNPEDFYPNPDYVDRYLDLPNPMLWRGLYVNRFTLSLPEYFKKKDSNEKILIGASRLLIDENGITGNIIGRRLLTLETGSAGGWDFSVEDFNLSFMANQITGFGFEGRIKAPLSEQGLLMDYQARISLDNKYHFVAHLNDSVDFNLFGGSKLRLEKTSFLQVDIKNRRFAPRLVLNGSMKLEKDGLSIGQLEFHKLTLASEAPEFSVEGIKYGGSISLYNFPITISDIRFKMEDRLAILDFDLKLNLMEGKIAATSHLGIIARHQENAWKYAGLSVNALVLENVELAGFSLAGEIRMEKDHPVFGNYFGGQIRANFNALSDAMQVNVRAIFGNKNFDNEKIRYWCVEGQTLFSPAIPIGPVALAGFTGGAYYRMKATGKDGPEAYEPNKNSSLGLKAGIAYSVGDKSAINGDAVFEINFLASGGIRNMRFYANAEFMKSLDLTNKLNALNDMYKQVQRKAGGLSGSLSENLPASLSGSDLAQKILPDTKPNVDISAYLTMNYDFPSKIFDADFKLMVSTPGGFLRGTGNNNEAGWVKLYCSPSSWYVHAGTPRNPIGLKLGLGPLSLSTESYFMLGDRLETPLPPDRNVLELLQMSPQQADYMKYPENMKLGKGIAFGSRFAFDTGHLTFLILYARFNAGMGFDIMLSDMSRYACEGSSSPVGINGWYANGQCYAYLKGDLGVQIKILGINKKTSLISGATAALLQAKGPNPTWIGGNLAVNGNVLGIKMNMKMKFNFGTECTLVALGDPSPVDYSIIADLSPVDKSTETDVFSIPQATLNMPEGSAIVSDENKTYRIKLESFKLTDSKGAELAGSIAWNKDRSAVTFTSFEILPPREELQAKIAVCFEEYAQGKWITAVINGVKAKEEKTVTFTTGDAPNYIPPRNIEYIYPVIDQKNMYASESTAGYIQLKQGQKYLFPPGFSYWATFTPNQGALANASYEYKESERRIEYTLPGLEKDQNYTLELTAATNSAPTAGGAIQTETKQITDDTGESFSYDVDRQMAQQLVKEGAVSILDYKFKTSKYNTLSEKLSRCAFKPEQIYVNEDTRTLYLSITNPEEIFDRIELAGSEYTGNQPMIQVFAALTDDYYTQDIAPKLYNWQTLGNIRITWRNVNDAGLPPAKAFYYYEGYINALETNTYNASLASVFPFVYDLPYYYYRDYKELFNKAYNYLYSYPNENDQAKLAPLLNGYLPFIRGGNYPANFNYRLPGAKKGATQNKIINYVNTLNWR